ncbi:NuA4 histone H4 acetyltransferase complex and the SWR1 complex subunit, partial [Ascosphaera pollenicola]
MALRLSSARIGASTPASSIRLSSQLRWTSNSTSTDSSAAAPSPFPAADKDTPVPNDLENKTPLRKFLLAPAVLKLPPKSMGDWVKERAPYIVNTYAKPDIVFARGKGPYLWDLEQNQYIDFTSGIGVCALGHADERIAKIIADQ